MSNAQVYRSDFIFLIVPRRYLDQLLTHEKDAEELSEMLVENARHVFESPEGTHSVANSKLEGFPALFVRYEYLAILKQEGDSPHLYFDLFHDTDEPRNLSDVDVDWNKFCSSDYGVIEIPDEELVIFDAWEHEIWEQLLQEGASDCIEAIKIPPGKYQIHQGGDEGGSEILLRLIRVDQ